MALVYNRSTRETLGLFNQAARRVFRDDVEGFGLRAALPFLAAASWAYSAAVCLRRKAYGAGLLRRRRLPVPVLSVGNITVGGSGKTPAVIALAGLLASRGLRVGVLSRGYGGAEPDKPLLVSGGRGLLCDDPAVAGDEPILIARRVPEAVVSVCRSRWKAGMLAIGNGCEILILDDGFQHLSLARDLDILIFRADDPWGNGRLLPRGPLREPLTEVRRAHLALLVREGILDAAAKAPPELESMALPVHNATFRATGLRPFWPSEGRASLRLAGTRVYCLSGIGSPDSFEHLATYNGACLAGHLALGDHHRYGREDLARAWRDAQAAGADLLLTTEKDGVKIRRLLATDTELRLPALPAAELVVSLDFPVDPVLKEIRNRVRLPIPDGER